MSTQLTQSISAEWLAALFPTKEEHKRLSWLKTLSDNEFETLSDLLPLRDSDWDSLSLPLAIKTRLREAVTFPTSSAPTMSITQPLVPASPQPEVTQVDCIVIDVSSSMRARSTIDCDKTREDVSKLLFHTLVDKLVGLELSHAVGLIAFGAEITPVGVTREYERFHDELGRLNANQGRTKLYDAILDAAKVVNVYTNDNVLNTQTAKPLKRVFVLTDGEDNASEHAPWQVAQFLQQHEIVLDAIPVAGNARVLQSISAATEGGLCFEVVSQEQGVGLFEREAVLHAAFREKAANAPPLISNMADLKGLEQNASDQGMVQDVVSAVKPVVHAPVMKVEAVEAKAATTTTVSSKRVLKDYAELMKSPLEGWSAFVTTEDVRTWKVVMAGPKGTPYEGGNWLITVEFPVTYPIGAPKFRFVTPIFHCNISADGNACFDLFETMWRPSMTIKQMFEAVVTLLKEPNVDNPLDVYKATLHKDDKEEYMKRAKNETVAKAGLSWFDLVNQYNLTAQ
eukprot:TRINITY_DN27377_c0_g1_i1.p1 TRINITY_DN27377_c0_g1~~TRINITY_DN27377_c0_g1_i1.p1  ORF type:complete len:529 (-),score=52.46 TRINITY_DN27377_c0_g1_i1:26-1558(-)